MTRLYEMITEFIPTEENLADEIRKMGFYVPDSMFSSVINPVRECIRILNNDFETSAPIPLIDVHLANLLHTIRHFLIPIYARISLYHTNPIFLAGIGRSRVQLCNIIRPSAIANGIRVITTSISYQPLQLDDSHRIRLLSIAKNLTYHIILSWIYCIRHLLLHVFIQGQRIHVSSGEHYISEGDRQTIAILLISALVNTGHLGDDFDWAR